MKNRLSWARAINVRGVCLTADERAAGWPDAFTLENLICLQYPLEGSTEEKKRAGSNQRALLRVMQGDIKAGALPAVERTRTETVYEEVPDVWASLAAGSASLGSHDWRARDTKPRMKRVKTGERTVTYPVIEARAFRAWLLNCEEAPSAHVDAWFEAVAVDVENEDDGPPQLTEMRRAAIVSQLSRHYPSLEHDFNRGESWIKECSTGSRGVYYLEKIKEGCRKKWGEAAVYSPPLATIRTHKMR